MWNALYRDQSLLIAWEGGRVLARDPMVKGETREEWKLKQARGREGGGEMGGSRVSDFARDQQNSNPLYINT